MTTNTPVDPTVFTIRRAQPADAALLAELGAETFAAAFGAQNRPEDLQAYLQAAFSPEIQACELAEPGSMFLIAEDQGEPAGYARLKLSPAPACIGGERPLEIARFYARTPWIGRGLGSALMQACLDESARLGCDVVWLSTWQRNPRGLAFYQKWNFTIVGETTFVLGSDLQEDFILQRLVSIPPEWTRSVNVMDDLMQTMRQKLGERVDDLSLPPPIYYELQGEILAFDPDAGTLTARYPVQERFLNPYRTLQGGMIAAAVDNVLGPLSLLVAPPNVTRRLELTFSRPVTLEMGYILVKARLAARHGRRLEFTADVLDPSGKRLARARAEHWLVDEPAQPSSPEEN